MAQVSAQMSQDHIVTAFHFLISNRGAVHHDSPPDRESHRLISSLPLFIALLFYTSDKVHLPLAEAEEAAPPVS